MELADFRLVVDVHLMGAVHCTKAVWETMRAQNYGRIVMTTSSSGLYGNFGQANYGAAKMALVGLMQTLSIEGAKNNIRVNCLAPTAATRMTEKLMPEAVLRLLEAGAVTPGLLALVADDAPTRAILCAGAGSFERAHVTLTQGIHVGQRRRRRRADRARSSTRSPIAPARPFPRAAPRRERSRSPRRCRRSALSGVGVARAALRRRARGGSSASTRSPARSAPGRSGSAAAPCSITARVAMSNALAGERRPAAADPAGEHVAGAGARERGVAGGVDSRRCRRRPR